MLREPAFLRGSSYIVNLMIMLGGGYVGIIPGYITPILTFRTGLESIPFETVMDQIRTFLRPIYETIFKEDEFFKEWICSDQKEGIDMLTEIKTIDKTGKTGLTKEKKEILKRCQGSASAPINLNKIRQWSKYGDS
jgi:hypothetical protein